MNFFLSKTLYKYFSWKEREIICYVDRKIKRRRPLLIRIASFFRIKWWWPVDFTNADGFSSYIFISFRWTSSEFMRRNFGRFSIKKKIISLSDVLYRQKVSEYTVWYEETCAGPEQYEKILSMTKTGIRSHLSGLRVDRSLAETAEKWINETDTIVGFKIECPSLFFE